ncbi:hypothetical protein [Gymnodinialimonas sp.]
MSILDRGAKLAEIVAATFIVIGGALAFVTFLNAEAQAKKRYTFELALSLLDDELREARFLLLREVANVIDDLPEGSAGYSNVASILRAQYASNRMLSSRENFEISALSILDHYGVARGCVEAELCNEAIFLDLTQAEAFQLTCFFSSTFDSISDRLNNPSASEGLEYFAGDEAC